MTNTYHHITLLPIDLTILNSQNYDFYYPRPTKKIFFHFNISGLATKSAEPGSFDVHREANGVTRATTNKKHTLFDRAQSICGFGEEVP